MNTTLPEPESLSIPFALIPPDIVSDYNLKPKVSNDIVYAKVNKGMYGLLQAGLLVNDDLVAHLALVSY